MLISAHFLGDFLLQPNWLVRHKDRFPYMLLHGGVHAGLAYGLYQAWSSWMLPLAVFIVHVTIDLIKQISGKDSARAFVWDQGTHLIILMGIGWFFTKTEWIPAFSGTAYVVIAGFAGFVATVLGAGYFVGKVAGKIKDQNALEIDGLKNGGALIGNLERALIFLLIFISQPAGIGFLVAAKSILRFEEAKNQKLAEYVLIGTLLSFSLAIAIATATKWAIRL